MKPPMAADKSSFHFRAEQTMEPPMHADKTRHIDSR
jgi:hypothetical protein